MHIRKDVSLKKSRFYNAVEFFIYKRFSFWFSISENNYLKNQFLRYRKTEEKGDYQNTSVSSFLFIVFRFFPN